MKFFALAPEVPGGFGDRTVLERDVHPPRIRYLHYVFEGWLGDQIVESFPAILVTAHLGEQLLGAGLTGIALSVIDEVETSPEFEELHGGRELPEFRRLIVSGRPFVDDFFMFDAGQGVQLTVSSRALSLLDSTFPTQLDRSEVEARVG